MRSRHTGEYWIGGYEVAGDKPQGTLTSAAFKVTHPFASFRVAGGPHRETAVELVTADGKAFYHASGHETENLEPVVVDLRSVQGQEIRIRLVDRHSGGWGHINFDDFRFHAARPNLPQRPAGSPLDDYAHAGPLARGGRRGDDAARGFHGHGCSPASRTCSSRSPWPSTTAAGCGSPRRTAILARVPEAEARDRILIFEDTDGDGRFDTRKGLRREAEPGQRPGGRLRRRVGRRRAVAAVHSRPRRRRPARRSAAGAARRLGLSGHARDAQRVHLGSRRLALRLPRRVHALAASASRARRTRSACRSTPASGAIIPRGTSSRSSPTARATPGASTSTTTARPSSRPA